MKLTTSEQKQLERLAAVMATVELIPEFPYAIVPSTTKKSTLYYVSHDGARSTGCDCEAAAHDVDCIHRLAVDRRLEQAREAAQEQALWAAGEAQELAGIDQYLAERTPEEIKEQSQIENLIRQGLDRPTAERITYARPAPKGKPAPKGNSPKAFSLLK